jgi:hypothetical protein
MLFGKELEVFDETTKYKIIKGDRVIKSISVGIHRLEDYEIDDGICYIKDVSQEIDCFERMSMTTHRIKLFEIYINGDLWTDIYKGYHTQDRNLIFGDKNILVERDWFYHNYTVFYNGKEIYVNRKRLLSSFHEIDICNQNYRYHSLALAITIDRASHYDAFDNTYW